MLVAGESGMKSYSFGDELMGLNNREKHNEREKKRGEWDTMNRKMKGLVLENQTPD